MPLFGRKTNSIREGDLVKNGRGRIGDVRGKNDCNYGGRGSATSYPNSIALSSSSSRKYEDVQSVRRIIMTETATEKPKLVFHCQQAQGSPTGLISGFSNVKELYEKIAECYDFPPDEVSL